MDSLPPWELVRDLLRTLILPSAGVSGIVLAAILLSSRVWSATPRGQLLAGAIALVSGLVAGNFFRGLLPWWSFEHGWPGLLPATLAVLLATIIGAQGKSSIGQRRDFILRWAAIFAAAYWLAPGDSATSHLGYFALLAAASLANFEVMHRMLRALAELPSQKPPSAGLRRADPGCAGGFAEARAASAAQAGEGEQSAMHGSKGDGLRAPPPPSPALQLPLALAVIWAGSAATVLVAAQSARFSEMAVLLAASLFPVALATISGKLDGPQLLVAPSVFLPGLMLNGQVSTYSQVPLASFWLIAFAPCVLVMLRLPAVRAWPALARSAAIPCILLLPCALGVYFALRAEPLDFSGH